MSNNDNSYLFRLIRSMTQAEKSYFKKFSCLYSWQKKNNYLRLFEEIDKQKKYDEEELLKKCGFYKKNQLPKLKQYLYSMILKSLELFYLDNNIDVRLNSMQNWMLILAQKGLNDLALIQSEKIKKSARHAGRNIPLLQVNFFREYLLRKTTGILKLKESDLVEEYDAERECLLTVLNNIRKIRNTERKLFRTEFNLDNIRNDQERENLIRIVRQEPLFTDESFAANSLRTPPEIHDYLITLSRFYTILGDTEQYNEVNKKIIELFEENPQWKHDNFVVYLDAYSRAINSCLASKNYTETKRLIEKTRFILDSNKGQGIKTNTIIRNRNRLLILEFEYYYQSNDFKKASGMVPSLLRVINNLERHEDRILLLYDLARLYIMTGEYPESIRWLNKLFSDPFTAQLPPVLSYTHLLNLIAHYELGNLDMTESLVKSAYRYLYKKQRLYKTEKLLLNFIKKDLQKLTHPKELIQAFARLHDHLIIVLKDPLETRALEYFDIVSWLKSKISGKTVMDIVSGNV